MTDLFGGYKSQTTLGLQRIDSSKYPDSNKDLEATLQRTVSFVDYISQYLQTMQKGIDSANKDPLTQIRDVVGNIGTLLGGGELLYGINLGDLQYYLPAIGALLGFDSDQPFPLNLFYAAEHFLLGYIVPLDSWGFAVEDAIDAAAVAFGLPAGFIDSLHHIIEALQSITSDIPDLFVQLGSIFDIFGVWGSTSLFADLWHAISTLLGGGFGIGDLGDITDPIVDSLAPWINGLATLFDWVDQILKAFTGGLQNLQGILNFASIFNGINFLFPDFNKPYGVGQLITNVLNTVTGSVTWLASMIPPLDASKLTSGILNALRIPDITKAMSSDLQGVVDQIYQAIHGGITVGNTVASIKDALMHFPGVNIIGSITAGIITGVLDAINIPGLDASKIVSGQLAQSFINNLGTDLANLGTSINSRLLKSIFNTRFKGGANLVSNPDFEDSNVYFSTYPNCGLTTAIVRTGTQSAKLTSDATNNPIGYLTSNDTTFQPILVAQGQVFYFEIYVYGKSTNVQTTGGTNGVKLNATFYDSTGTATSTSVVSNLTASTALNGLWTKMSGNLLIPSGVNSIVAYVGLGSNVTTGEVYYFDNAVVRETTDANAINRALFNSDLPLSTILAAIVPGLDATKIVTGIFGTGRIPNLPASIINTGTFLASLIPNLNASIINAGTFIASLIPGLDASKIITGQFLTSLIPNLNASIINAGTFLSSLIPNLNASIINAGTFLATLIPGLDASKIITGVLNATIIPALDAAKIATGTFARALFGIPDYENLAAGGSFEAGSNPWSISGGWATSTAQAHSGTISFSIAGSASNSSVSTLAPGTFEVKPNDQIYMEFWMYRDAAWDGTSSNCKLRIGNAADSSLVDALTFASTDAVSATWTKRTLRATIPAGCNGIVFTLVKADGTAGNIWIDDIVIRRVKPANIIGDLDAAIVKTGTFLGSLIPNLNASIINAGTFIASLIPSLDASKIATGQFLTSLIPNLNASIITAGIFLSSLIPNLNASIINAGTFLASLIPSLDASKITSGILGALRIPDITKAMSADLTKMFGNFSTTVAKGPNLATNPSFENTTLANGSATSTDQAHTGTRSLKLTANGSNYIVQPLICDDVGTLFTPAVAGDVFYIEFWVYGKSTNTTTGTNVFIQTDPLNSAGANISFPQVVINGGTALNGVWTKVSGYVTMPAGTVKTDFIAVVDAASPAGNVYYFDDVVIKEYTHTQNLIDNIVQSVTGTLGVGNLVADVKYNLSHFPGANIVSALLAGVIPSLDASKITSGQFAQSFITGLTNLSAAFFGKTSAGPNLVVDPSFENPTIWAGPGSSCQISTTRKFSGTQSMKLMGTDAFFTPLANGTGATDWSTYRIKAKSDQKFKISGKVWRESGNSSSGSLYMGTQVLDGTGAASYPGTGLNLAQSAITVGVWTDFSVLYVVPSTGYITAGQPITDVAFYIQVPSVASGDIFYIDDISITEVTETQSIISMLTGGLASLGSTIAATVIPNLNASIINAGTFLSSLIPSLDASKITTGVMNALRIPDITAAMSSGVTAANNALQTLYETLYNGVKGVPLIGATLANILSGFQSLMTTLFNNNAPQSTVTPTVVPLLSPTKIDPLGGKLDQQNVPDVTRNMSNDTQTIIDGVHQVANGGGSTGNPADSIVTNLQKLFQPPTNPSTAAAVTVDAVGAGGQVNLTNSYVTATTNWNHTIGATANMLVVTVVWESGPLNNIGGTSAFNRTVLCGASAGVGVPMTSILVSKGTASFTEMFILQNPPIGAKVITATVHSTSNYLGGNFCDGIAGESVSLIGFGQLGALDVESGTGVGMSQTIATTTSAIVVQAFVSERPSFAVASISSYNKTQDYYSGNYYQGIKNVSGVNLPTGAAFLTGHAAGAASVNFTANEANSGDNWYGIAVAFLPSNPNPIGSTFRAYRSSATAATALLAATDTKLAASFFDTTTGAKAYCTPDITYDSPTNKVTVNYSGTYNVNLTLSVSASISAASLFQAVLWLNNVVVRRSTSAYIPASPGMAGTISLSATLALNAGDYLEPGGLRSISTTGNAVFIGNSGGDLSSFEVALDNRSLN